MESTEPFAISSEMSMERLVELFREFSEQSTALRTAYAELEHRVAQLSVELARKDREIYSGYNNLWEFQTYLDSILESIPIGLVVLDLQGEVTRLNRAARDLLNLAPEEIPSGTLFLDQEPIASLAVGNPDLGEQVLPTMREFPRPEGVLIARQVVSWLTNRNGVRIGMVVTLEDMTTVHRLEQRIDQQKTLVALGEMAAHVAHELRNPLFGISGFAQMLLEEMPENDSRYRLAQKINEGSETLNRIATTLLNYTSSGEPNFIRCDLKQLVVDVAELTQSERKDNKPLDVQLELPEENVAVTIDPDLLREALLNLAKNARQAMPDGGCIKFSLRWDLMKNRVFVGIADTGIGMTPEVMSKMFNPFFTTRSTGTGLGLSVVHKVIQLHHGTIDVDSKPGAGTKFTLEIPIV